jgi:hypothetical protein
MKKHSFLVLAVMMTVAGVASAFALAPPEPAARELPMPVVAKQPAVLPVAAAPEPAIKKASFEVRHAPVPLLMKPRPTIAQPIFDADAVGLEVPVKTSVGSSEGAAKAAIEADGYKGVKALRQGANGMWYAKAMRGTAEVPLTVDAAGRVALE